MVDEKTVKISHDSPCDVAFARWHEAAEIDTLVKAIEKDAAENGYGKISFLSHSAGYQIAQAVMSEMKLKVERLVSISILNEKVIEKALNVADISNVPDAVFKEAYKHAAFYVDDHLPIDQIKRQSALLLKAMKFRAIAPHLAIAPKDDTICERPEGAAAIAGSHQASSFDMAEIYKIIKEA